MREGLTEICAHDILFWVNAFAWTFDPRTKKRLLPFITWPYQDRAFIGGEDQYGREVSGILPCIEEGRDLVIEKSRDMGASWKSLTAMSWLFSYQRGTSFLMVSRKEDLVDAPGDPDSLFWKVDFLFKHLPEWLRPDIDRRKLHFGNRGNDATIDGESTTAAAGVGGRRTAMFIDEFSRIEEGYQLLAGTADTTRCRIFNFTPFGTSNAAYKLARRGDIRKLRLHWSEHPEKAQGLYQYDLSTGQVNVLDTTFHYPVDFHFVMDGRLRSPWYDGECTRRANDREVAQMLDIDYQGSSFQFFDKSMVSELQRAYCRPPDWEGDISFDQDTGRPIELTPASGGPLKLWCQLDDRGRPPVAPYGGGADLSTGSGATNSCLSFVNGRTGAKVMEYASPYLRVEQLAPRATALCWMFKDERGEPVRFCWEMQGPGINFGKLVIGLGYRNVYFRTNEHSMAQTMSDTPGWFPSDDNRRSALEDYRSALSTRQMLNPSHEALEECLFFIHTSKGKVEHSNLSDQEDPTGARGNHGDRVIADALAWKMVKGMYAKGESKPTQQILPGSLAWRRALADNLSRQSESWGA